MTKYESQPARRAAKEADPACACASPRPALKPAPEPLAQSSAHYEERAKLLKALAHPARLYITECLEDRSLCVEELTSLIGSDMSTISKHLRVLKEAGVVRDTRDGRRIYYSLAVPCVLSFFGCIEQTLEANREGGGR